MRWELRLGGSLLATCALFAAACDDGRHTSIDVGAGSGGGGVAAGGSPSGGSVLLPSGGSPVSEFCSYTVPRTPLTRWSLADLDGTLDAYFGTGPRLADAVEYQESGFARDVSAVFLAALRRTAQARIEPKLDEADSLEVCEDDADDAPSCAQRWLRDWGLRLYRRPLEPEQLAAYRIQFQSQLEQRSARDAAATALLSMLLSPYFVLRLELGLRTSSQQLSPFEVAARLSHLVVRRSPDAALAARAAADQLQTPEQLQAELDRLSALPEARTARQLQHREWLGLDTALPPELDPDLGGAMEAQLSALIDEVFVREDGSLRALLTSTNQTIGESLALHYGATSASKDLFAGVLATGAFLTRYPRPSERGAQILQAVLCQKIAPHPVDLSFSPGMGDTPRQRIQNSVSDDPRCKPCHAVVDPPGFALEAFDEQGRLTGFDSSGSVTLALGAPQTPVSGPLALGAAVAESEPGLTCAAQRYLEYALDRPLGDLTQPLIIAPAGNPDEEWLSCAKNTLFSSQGSLSRLTQMLATSALMQSRATASRYVVAFDTSLDPLEHAYQETLQFRGVYPDPEDDAQITRYLDALAALKRQDEMPPEASAGAGSGGEAGEADAESSGGAAGAAAGASGGAP